VLKHRGALYPSPPPWNRDPQNPARAADFKRLVWLGSMKLFADELVLCSMLFFDLHLEKWDIEVIQCTIL
jgi:hypothetical protein